MSPLMRVDQLTGLEYIDIDSLDKQHLIRYSEIYSDKKEESLILAGFAVREVWYKYNRINELYNMVEDLKYSRYEFKSNSEIDILKEKILKARAYFYSDIIDLPLMKIFPWYYVNFNLLDLFNIYKKNKIIDKGIDFDELFKN